MKIDKRVEKNTLSVIGIRDLLQAVIQSPITYVNQQSLLQALISQGALAKYSDESKNIYPSSINTVKRIAEKVLDGGFDALDRLRKAAHDAITKEQFKDKKSNKASKVGLAKRVEELEMQNQIIREDLLLLTMAFETSLNQGFRYAMKGDASLQALCKREQRELFDMLTLRRHPLPANVKKIRED